MKLQIYNPMFGTHSIDVSFITWENLMKLAIVLIVIAFIIFIKRQIRL